MITVKTRHTGTAKTMEDMIDELRQLYREKRYYEMKKKFYGNMFFVPKNKVKQIQKAIDAISPEDMKLSEELYNKGRDLKKYCVDELGYRLIE